MHSFLQHRYKHIAILIIAMCLMLSFISAPAFSEKTPSRADLQQLNRTIKAAEKSINKKKGQSGKLQNSLRKTEVEISNIERDARSLQKAIKKQQLQLKKLQGEQTSLNKNRRQLEQEIADQVAASYRLGREEKIKLLLNQQDPKKLSRSLSYADYFNQARLKSMNEFQITINTLESLKPKIKAESDNLLANKNQLIERKKQLKKRFSTRSKTLTSIHQSIKNDQGQLKKLQEDQKHLADLLKAVETTVSNIQLPSDAIAFIKTKGRLPWPTKGALRNRFGRKRSPSNLRWQGISFLGKPGKDVNAIHHGRVIFADWFRGKGLLTIIDHGDGYMSLYAHQQTLLREAGDWVSAEENIGTVGSSGGLDHAELYFEIRQQGKAINPMRWLQKNG